MENSNEFLVLRDQEEIGKRLLQNLKLNKKVWLILMEKIESLSEQSKGGIIRTSEISGSRRKLIGEKLGG